MASSRGNAVLAWMNCDGCSTQAYVKVPLREGESVQDAMKKKFSCNKCKASPGKIQIKQEPKAGLSLKRKSGTSDACKTEKDGPVIKSFKKMVLKSEENEPNAEVIEKGKKTVTNKSVPAVETITPRTIIVKLSESDVAKDTAEAKKGIKKADTPTKQNVIKLSMSEDKEDEGGVSVISIEPDHAGGTEELAALHGADNHLVLQNESLLNQIIAASKGNKTVHLAIVTDSEAEHIGQETSICEEEEEEDNDPVVGEVHSLLKVNAGNKKGKRFDIRLSEIKRRLEEPEKMSISTLIHYLRKSKTSEIISQLKKCIADNNLPLHSRVGVLSSFSKLTEDDMSGLVSDFLSLSACYLPTLQLAEQNAANHVAPDDSRNRISDLEATLRTLGGIQQQIQSEGGSLDNVTHGGLGLMTGVLSVVQEMLSQEKMILTEKQIDS